MSPTSTTAVLLALAATYLHLHFSLGAPQKREAGPSGTASSVVADEECAPQCRPFHHPYCNSFPNFYFAQFPNPRQSRESDLPKGVTYEQEAVKEFNDFIPLLNTKCSDKLGTLLCFFYFPFCSPYFPVNIRPCRSLCEEVCSECAEELEAVFAERGFPGYGWKDLPQFNCSNYEFDGCNGQKGEKVFIEKQGQCANDTQMPWPLPSVDLITTPNPMTGPKDTTEESTEMPPTEEITEAICSPCTGTEIKFQYVEPAHPIFLL